MLNIFFYTLIPAVCMLLGGIFASMYRPGERLTSATQHFAAGVVFAAVAKELLPKLGEESGTFVLVIGFMLGIISMLLLKKFTESLSERKEAAKGMPWGLIGGVAIDVFIDGILIGIAFLVGTKGGILIAVALAIEVLFLGLSTSATLHSNGVTIKRSMMVIFILALLLPFGSISGAGLLSQLPQYYTEGLLAFGVAALLYLVTEELLLEAHERDDTAMVTLSFFIGFLLILLLEKIAAA